MSDSSFSLPFSEGRRVPRPYLSIRDWVFVGVDDLALICVVSVLVITGAVADGGRRDGGTVNVAGG